MANASHLRLVSSAPSDAEYRAQICALYHRADCPTVNPIDPISSLNERIWFERGFSLACEDSTLIIYDTLGHEVVRIRRSSFMAAQYWAARALANPEGFTRWLDNVD